MYYFRDPPATRCYSTSFLPVTRQLLSSQHELAKEVKDGASLLRRFISLSGLTSSQSKVTEWTKEQLRSLWDQACRARVRSNELTREFLEQRDDPHYLAETLGRWRTYQERRERRCYWSQALRCNYDWDSDMSKILKRLFGIPKADDSVIKLSEDQGKGWIMSTSKSHVPEVLTFEYRTPTGEVRYKTFHADCSAEDVTPRNYAADDSIQLSSTPEEPAGGSSSSEGRLEYKNVIDCREMNRHARRKIEGWLNDGWSVEWEWNGKYCEESKHQMTLTRSDENLPPSPSKKRIVLEFPTTPSPWDTDFDLPSEWLSASDAGSDSK